MDRQYALTTKGVTVNVYCAGTASQHYTDADSPNSAHPVEIAVQNGNIVGVRWYTLSWDVTWGAFLPKQQQGLPPLPTPQAFWPIQVH